MAQTDPHPDTPELDDTIATIACLFMGFTPIEYWKRAVNDQHPEALKKSEASLTRLLAKCELEGRIEELKTLKSLHSRTYTQTVTDNAGNVYMSDTHGYISSYETQERLAELREELAKYE